MLDNIKTPCILIAMPQLQDPNFARSVMLMVDFSEEGAMGFIINRPSELPLAAILKGPGIDIPKQIPTWTGGPVGISHGLILTTDCTFEQCDDDIIFPDFGISSSEHCLANLIDYAENFDEEEFRAEQDGHPLLYPYRFLVGYAGWGAGQLESELRDGSWISLPYNHDLLFKTPWPKIWDEAMAKLGINPVDIATAQPSTYLN